jgi:hypothetical protein
MIGAGTFISPLIKIITTVAILAAVYFFIVKPVLETTESTIDRSFQSIEGFGDLQPDVKDSIRDAEKLADEQQAASAARIKEANKLLDCITAAGADTAEIERCNERFDPSNP